MILLLLLLISLLLFFMPVGDSVLHDSYCKLMLTKSMQLLTISQFHGSSDSSSVRYIFENPKIVRKTLH